MSTDTTPTSIEALAPRYKIGYRTDEWGERSSTPGGIPDPAGAWVRYDDHAAALARAAHAAAPIALSREELIAMAREADPFGDDGRLVSLAMLTPGTLERFAALVAAREREACAQVCRSEMARALYNLDNDLGINRNFWNGGSEIAASCAASITARRNP